MTIQREAACVVSATREVTAGPGWIFELIADPTQQPRWEQHASRSATMRAFARREGPHLGAQSPCSGPKAAGHYRSDTCLSALMARRCQWAVSRPRAWLTPTWKAIRADSHTRVLTGSSQTCALNLAWLAAAPIAGSADAGVRPCQ